MANNLHLDGEFTLNIPHIDGDFVNNEQPDIQADFHIKVTPEKVSQLENDLNYQTQEQVQEAIQAESDVINSRIDDEVETLNDRIDGIEESSITNIIGVGNISATQDEHTVTITSTTYVHTQAIASDTWVIQHNLNKHPSVVAVDSAESVQIPDDIDYDTNNRITVKFLSGFSGKAYLN